LTQRGKRKGKGVGVRGGVVEKKMRKTFTRLKIGGNLREQQVGVQIARIGQVDRIQSGGRGDVFDKWKTTY